MWSHLPRDRIHVELHGGLACGIRSRVEGKSPTPAPGSYNPSMKMTRSRSLGAVSGRAKRDTNDWLIRNRRDKPPIYDTTRSLPSRSNFNYMSRLMVPSTARAGYASSTSGITVEGRFYPNEVQRDLSQEKYMSHWASPTIRRGISPSRMSQHERHDEQLSPVASPRPSSAGGSARREHMFVSNRSGASVVHNWARPAPVADGNTTSQPGSPFHAQQPKNELHVVPGDYHKRSPGLMSLSSRPGAAVDSSAQSTASTATTSMGKNGRANGSYASAFAYAPKPRNFYGLKMKEKVLGNSMVSSTAPSSAASSPKKTAGGSRKVITKVKRAYGGGIHSTLGRCDEAALNFVGGTVRSPTSSPKKAEDVRRKTELQSQIRESILRNREDLDRRARMLQIRRMEMAEQKYAEFGGRHQHMASAASSAPRQQQEFEPEVLQLPASLDDDDDNIDSMVEVKRGNRHANANRGAGPSARQVDSVASSVASASVGMRLFSSKSTPSKAGDPASEEQGSPRPSTGEEQPKTRGASKLLDHVMKSNLRWSNHAEALRTDSGVRLSAAKR
ncbi:unnamed protein product [Amoebophrya sp. A25]|nr:unnamed protein product [Amoebophrya sp. A25]|eukprot:GSA25T00015435001.1